MRITCILSYISSLFFNKQRKCGDLAPFRTIYSDIRREDIILTRLRIGHSRLTHKHYLLREDYPECIPYDCRLTIKHVLIECIDTADIRKQYFNCTDLKTLFNSVAGDTILAYLSEINLIRKKLKPFSF